MASFLEDLGSYIIAGGLATVDGVDYFRDNLPVAPDNVIACIVYGGTPQLLGDSSMGVRVQANIRATTYAAARSKAFQLYDLLSASEADGGICYLVPDRYAIIDLTQPPFKLAIDEENRVVFVFNFYVTTNKDID